MSTPIYPTGWLPAPPDSPPTILLGENYVRELLEHTPPLEAMLPRAHWRQWQAEESCFGRVAVGLNYEHTGDKGSAEAIWYWARLRNQGPDVQDTGVTIAAIRWALARFGVPSASKWNPSTPGFAIVGKKAKPPALAVLKTKKLDTPVLYGTGGELNDASAAALGLGLPVAYVVGAGGQFNDQRDGIVGPRTESRKANHILYTRGFRTRANGRREYRTANTWLGWGDEEGCAWVDQSWLESSEFVVVCRGISP